MNWLKDEISVLAWVPAALWSTVILFFSVLPIRSGLPLTVGHFDKMAHFFEYMFLALLIARGIYRTKSQFSPRSILIALIFTVGYGILMELVQQFVPGRCASIADVAANVTGAGFGLFLGKMVIWQE